MADYDADIIVVGSGGLGATVALEAALAGKSVVMLEAGPEIPDWKIIQNWRSSPRKENTGDPYGNFPWAPNALTTGYLNPDTDLKRWPNTARVVGGTARHWTGITWRFLPEDFKLKSLRGVGRDWPIDYDEMEPFYTDAEYLMGVCGLESDDQSGVHPGQAYPARSKPYPQDPEAKPYSIQRLQMRVADRGMRLIHSPTARATKNYDGRPACIGNNLCEPACPINAKFSGLNAVDKARLAGAQLRVEVVVDKLEVDSAGKITSLGYQTRAGARETLTAKAYVIAGHGYETPKLLLMNGLANRSGQVGRNLMVHPGALVLMQADEPLWFGRGQYSHGSFVNRRIGPHQSSSSGFTMGPWNASYATLMTNAMLGQKMIGSTLDGAIRKETAHNFACLVLTEDLPDPANGVSLNPGWKDALGLPGLNFRYKVADYTNAAMPNILNDMANLAQALGVTQPPVNLYWGTHNHIMGTVVMGDDPADSVVDRNLRCHDHPNLFLVSTGVHASSTAFNPTLTGYALAIRAGRYIAAEL